MKTVWVARDCTGRLEMYIGKPREINGIFFQIQGRIGLLPNDWFPELTLENSPQEIELKLKNIL